MRPIRSCAGRMDSDPTGVQSPGAQPSHVQLPYVAGQGRHAARHGAGGTGPHPSPCRIPPPRGGEPSSAGRPPDFAAAEPRGCDGAWGAPAKGPLSLSPAAGGRDRRAVSSSPHPQTRSWVDFFPPTPNAEEQLAGAPLLWPGSHARPAEPVCMAQTFSPCKVSFQAGIPPAFGFT